MTRLLESERCEAQQQRHTTQQQRQGTRDEVTDYAGRAVEEYKRCSRT
jgi:hypothetical protein